MKYHYFSALKPLFDKIKSYSYSKTETDTKLSAKADKATTLDGYSISDSYTKSEVDSKDALKADKATTYTKTEVDSKEALKADKSDTYTKSEVDYKDALKADKATTYTKTEVDTAISNYKVTTDTALSSTSENPVQNKVITAALGNKPDKATTLSGYGITDAYTKTEVDAKIASSGGGGGSGSGTIVDAYTKAETDEKLSGKADKATTLDGYGITDVYTKTEVDALTIKKSYEQSSASAFRKFNYYDATGSGMAGTPGSDSFAQGSQTSASGDCSHAEGAFTKASGDSSHAEGWYTEAFGRRSHSEGFHTIAHGEDQHAEGKYNVSDSNNTYVHIVGGGSSDTDRKNIYTLDWSGNAVYAGSVTAPGFKGNADTATKATQDSDGNPINTTYRKVSDSYSKTEIDSKIASSGGSGASDSLFVVTFGSTLDTSTNKIITTADKTMDEIVAAYDANKIIIGVCNGGGTSVLNAYIDTADPSDIQAKFVSSTIYVSRAYNDEFTAHMTIEASHGSNSYVWTAYTECVRRFIGTITILKSAWDSSNKTAVINTSDITTIITENSTIIVSPTSSSHSAYVNAGILATKQEKNEITFQCDEIPTVDIEVSVIIRTLTTMS
jgi:hypothetical protein